MGHFIKKCKKCQAVISQCRCMDCNKTIEWGLCRKCYEAPHNAENKRTK